VREHKAELDSDDEPNKIDYLHTTHGCAHTELMHRHWRSAARSAPAASAFLVFEIQACGMDCAPSDAASSAPANTAREQLQRGRGRSQGYHATRTTCSSHRHRRVSYPGKRRVVGEVSSEMRRSGEPVSSSEDDLPHSIRVGGRGQRGVQGALEGRWVGASDAVPRTQDTQNVILSALHALCREVKISQERREYGVYATRMYLDEAWE
jgi:hypothetical protein